MKEISDETKRVLQDIMTAIDIDAQEAKKAVFDLERDKKTYVRDLYAQKGIYRGIEHAKGLIIEYCREFLHISYEGMKEFAEKENGND